MPQYPRTLTLAGGDEPNLTAPMTYREQAPSLNQPIYVKILIQWMADPRWVV
jgi:hypothetical protein